MNSALNDISSDQDYYYESCELEEEDSSVQTL